MAENLNATADLIRESKNYLIRKIRPANDATRADPWLSNSGI